MNPILLASLIGSAAQAGVGLAAGLLASKTGSERKAFASVYLIQLLRVIAPAIPAITAEAAGVHVQAAYEATQSDLTAAGQPQTQTTQQQ